MGGCRCDLGLGSLGRPNCVPIQSVTKRFIFVEMNDANRINLTSSPTDLVPGWQDKPTNTNVHQRWFPSPIFESIALPKADSKFEEAPSGRKVFIRQGKRSFTGEFWAEDSHPAILKSLKAYKCVKFGVFMVDINGNLVGIKDGSWLKPIEVDAASFDPQMSFADDNAIQKIKIQFDFALSVKEEDLFMLTAEEYGFNFLTDLDVPMPVEIYLEPFADGNNAITIDVANPFISNPTGQGVEGLDDTAFLVTDETTNSAYTLGLVVDNGNGNYLLNLTGDLVGGHTVSVIVVDANYSGEASAIVLPA